MFKIGEFSRLMRVSARMLRYYDKCGIFCPAQLDDLNGYRLYSTEQIPQLNRIISLRDLGFGVEEIGEILPHYDNMVYMKKVLERKQKDINLTILSEQEKLFKIAAMSGVMEKEKDRMIYDVELKKLDAVKVLSLRESISSYDQEGRLWEKLGNFAGKHGIDFSSGGYSIYHDGDYKEDDVDVQIAVPVPALKENEGEFKYLELPAITLAATIRFSGPYDNYSSAMEKLATWIEKNGYEFDGLLRGLTIVGPANKSNPQEYLTELQVQVKK